MEEDTRTRKESYAVLSLIPRIVAHNRRRDDRLSHITEARSTWDPDRKLAKKEQVCLTRG